MVRVPPGREPEGPEGLPGPGPAVSAAALVGSEAPRSGLQVLRGGEVFNLLCLPAACLLPEADAAAVYAAADALCTARGALLLVDPLRATGEPPASGLRSPNAAAYLPAVIVDDPVRPDTTRVLGPSGGVAGVFARLDAARGPWRTPAGLAAPLSGVLALARALSSEEIDRRTRAGINPLVAFPDRGPLVWGARTLAGAEGGASEWKYIPVRRLGLFLEASVSHGTEWAVFEPQGDRLFDEVRQTVAAFLDSLWRQGAFAGRQPREAYFVTCDRTNNPPGAPISPSTSASPRSGPPSSSTSASATTSHAAPDSPSRSPSTSCYSHPAPLLNSRHFPTRNSQLATRNSQLVTRNS